jgi:hypothetical protein
MQAKADARRGEKLRVETLPSDTGQNYLPRFGFSLPTIKRTKNPNLYVD